MLGIDLETAGVAEARVPAATIQQLKWIPWLCASYRMCSDCQS